MLRLESTQAISSAIGSESENGLPTDVQAISTAIGRESEHGFTTAVQPSAEDTMTNEWVDIFVQEMTKASSMEDARARTATALEALKKSILDPARAKAAAPDPASDTHGSL